MQPADQQNARPGMFPPRTTPCALIGAGVLAAAFSAIFPSAPTSDSWLPYEVQLRMSADAPGRVALWWDRHAGYVTASEAVQILLSNDEFTNLRIPCPSGAIVRLLLQLPPVETRMQPVATIHRYDRLAATLSLHHAKPLHGTCAITWENDVLVVRPLTTSRDCELEWLLQPALNLPVPLDGAPAVLAIVVQYERALGVTLAALGLGLLVLIARLARSPGVLWETRPVLRGVIVTYATLAIVFARRPDIFALPQFWAEDGAVFFAEQYQHGLSAVLKPYAGYLHLWPRLVAAAASGFPFVWSPAIYLFGSVVALLLAVWRTASPRAGLAAPGACAFAVVLVPRMGEVLLNVTNAQWFGALALLLVALSRPPVSRTERAGDVFTLLVFGLTGPFTLLLVPLFLGRVWRDRDSSAWVALTLAVATAGVQATLFAQQPSVAPQAGDAVTGLLPLVVAAGLRTGGEFLGLATWVGSANAGWLGVAALAAWMLIWCVPGRVSPRGTTTMLAWAACVVLVGGLARFRDYPEELFLATHAQRYFHLPLLVTIWMLLSGLARATGWRRMTCGVLLGLLILQLATTFRIAPMVDFQWRDHGRAFSATNASTIPINPAPWAVVLPAAPREAEETPGALRGR